MRMLLTCLAVLLISSPIPVVAEYELFTAGWLRDMCAGKPGSLSTMNCLVYIHGLREGATFGRVDALLTMGELKKKNLKASDIMSNRYSSSCVPEDVTLEQLGEMLVKHMNENPESLHKQASFQFGSMLRKHFPCKSN